ncbi:MAG: iron complex outermembrane receptor protein [Cryomorphaceae bacterium]|jgi:iron complex outermembrane receptor protein
MSKSFKKSIAIAALAGLLLPSVSFAQESLLEEIVVTAAKRSQTLQEIPIAVSVTSAETIEQANILDISDLQSVVPSLRVSQLQNSTNTNFVIRGFGNGANNPGIEPSVGVFIDGVYRSRSAGAISDLPALERVEVLRGPQSTLFGKNASAGVINIVTRKPTGDSGGRVSATLGDYNQVVLKGQIEGAISDTAAFMISAGTNSRDGYITNLTTGGELNDRDRQNFRGQLLLSPGNNTEIRIIADFDEIDEICCGTVNLVAGPTLGAINFAGGTVIPNDAETLDTRANLDSGNTVENSGVSMQIDHDFDNFTLTSISSFRNVDSWSIIDSDFTDAPVATNTLTTEIDTFTQELRLTSTNGDKVDWMIGGFYFDESLDYQDAFDYQSGTTRYFDALSGGGYSFIQGAIGLPGAFGNPGQGVTEEATLDNQAISLFGTLDFHISDRLTASLGLNYTDDEKEASQFQSRQDGFAALDFTAIGTAFLAGGLIEAGFPPASALGTAAALIAADPTNNPIEGLKGLQFLPPYLAYPNAIEDGKSQDDKLTYSFRLAYDYSDSVNMYVGVSTGFKATSWNLSRNGQPDIAIAGQLGAAGLLQTNQRFGQRFALPEEATVLELGVKARFERGSFNLAIFDQEIENFQSNAFVGTGFALANAGKQSVQGVEVDFVYYPTDALQLTFAATFLDPLYDSFQNAGRNPITGATVDLSGFTPGGINEVSASASATYRFNIGNNEAYIRGDYFFEDTINIGDLTEDPNLNVSQFQRDSRNLNVSAGINTDTGLGFSIWARNLTDHTSLISAFPSVAQGGSFTGYRSAPRTFGVTVSKDF